MSYTDLTTEQQIIVAAEHVGLGVPIPHEIAAHLGPDLVSEIQNPGVQNADTAILNTD